jgi:large subunit ribosomal protein L23
MIIKSKYDLIKRPVITEKSTNLGEFNQYVFDVSSRSDKNSVKKAIEEIFGVKVLRVNILNRQGKVKKFKGILGRRADVKKAIVTVDKDQIIDLAGGVR